MSIPGARRLPVAPSFSRAAAVAPGMSLCDNAPRNPWRIKMRRKLTLAMFSALLLVSTFGIAQTKKASAKSSGSAPDKAHLQNIWDGWSTLDVANVADYYSPGAHTFFDIAPLKYSSWEEYQKGV